MLQLAMKVLWPAFLVAVVAEGCFFSIFDPRDFLHVFGEHELPNIAGYTMGFFFFWAVCSLTSGLTIYLALPPEKFKE